MHMPGIVTPWEVLGEVDYEKLLREFGLEKLDDKVLKKLPKPLHIYIERGLFYAHRDLGKALETYKETGKLSIVTGRGPSGRMHIGHLIPFEMAKWFQETLGVNVYICISDDEKFCVHRELSLEEVEKYAMENILDILALGFKPGKTFVLRDFEFTDIYKYACRVSRHITFSMVRAIFGLKEESNIGWIFYPAIQCAHLLIPQFLSEPHPVIVPIGIDQDPFIRLCRDVAPKLKLVKPSAILSKFLPGLLNPRGKMSTTGSEVCIWLTDTYKEIRKKLFKYAFTGGQPTVEEQRAKGGNPDICVVYMWLEKVFERDSKKIAERKRKCMSGELLCGECKEDLAKYIASFLEEHRRRREKIVDQLDKYMLT